MKSNNVLWDVAMFMGHQWVWFTKKKTWKLFTDPYRGTVGQRIGFYQHLPPCGVDGSQMWWNQDITDTHRHPCGDSYEVKIIPHKPRGRFKDFFSFPYVLGKWSNFTKIFQMGWSNHQVLYVPRRPIPRHPCAKNDAFFTPPFRSNFEAAAAGTRCNKKKYWSTCLGGNFWCFLYIYLEP